MKQITTNSAPKAIGPYSQAILSNNLLFVSGQIPIDPSTGKPVTGSPALQTKTILKNVGEILKKAGCTYKNIIKTEIFLTRMDCFAEVNEAYGSFFSEPYPARTTVVISSLPKGASVEISVIAAL
ncbi:RidA family protein [bacterium]|jgi:2-iminobutanoate/2-iminopropanoate deaminase|nr:RidA family protein [bacterium]